MKHISLAVGLVAATTLVLAVSACAPAVHGAPSSTGHSHATAKPHPHARQAAVPTVRVPVKCGALFTDAAASALIDSPINIHQDASTIPVAITDITQRQYGSLHCVWAGDAQDSGYAEDLQLDITPDAKAGFVANLSGFANENPPVVTNSAGDQSVYGCDATGGALNCVANMLVGDYWVTASLTDIGDTTISQATSNTRIQQVLTTAAAALKNTTAGPAWVPPGAALPTFCSSNASTAQVNTALGVSDFALVGEDEQETDAASYTQLAGTYTQCAWGTGSTTEPFTFLEVAMLKGGAWIIPQLPGQKDTYNYMLDTYSSMSVPGATAAAGDCSVPANECEVALSIGSLLVVVNLDDPSTAQSSAALAAIVADIKAS
jgi:hypothetical protein